METLFEWTPDISVGDEIIDRQHQKLLKEVNELLSALVSGSADTEIGKTVAFLSEYINEHLAYEEKYMEEHKYPEIEFHKSLHKNFIDHYEMFKKELTDGVQKKELIMEVEAYIGNWWIQHIRNEDKKYALFIKEKENKK